MPHSTEDNLGRRRFLLHRDKAVEHALEKIRRAPAAEWESLTPEDRADLKRALTEIWESCCRDHWEQFCFSTLSKQDLLSLISLVKRALEQHHTTCDARDAIERILIPRQ